MKRLLLSDKKIPKHDLLKPLLILLTAISGGLVFSSCNNNETEKTNIDGKIKVLVSIPPQKYFVEKIGGDKVDVKVLIPAGTNSHLFDPTPGDLIGIAGTDIYFYNGYLDFEKYWIDNILENNQQLIPVKVSQGVQFLSDSNCSDHSHECHDHGVDPHIWLSIKNARIIAANIYEHLVEYFPQHQNYLAANYKLLLGEIDSLDKEIKTKLSKVESRKFMIFHPSLYYYAEEFGLEQIPIELEGKEPTPKHIKVSIDRAKEAGIHTIFIQKEFDLSNARIISEELGGVLVQIDPLSEDWHNNLLLITDNIANASIKQH